MPGPGGRRLKIDPADLDSKEKHTLLLSAIVPRPIAFVSTRGRDGTLNLAPFSFFMGVTTDPPIVAVSVGRRKGRRKDTSRNIAETGEFVVNVVDESVAQAMVEASGDYPPEDDEFAITGLTPVRSERVAPPRVRQCKVSMECRESLTLSVGRSKSTLILGEVLLVHIDDAVLDGHRIDPKKLRPVGRLGGASYNLVRDTFELARPRIRRSSPPGGGR